MIQNDIDDGIYQEKHNRYIVHKYDDKTHYLTQRFALTT